jgi:hypothetical protein
MIGSLNELVIGCENITVKKSTALTDDDVKNIMNMYAGVSILLRL